MTVKREDDVTTALLAWAAEDLNVRPSASRMEGGRKTTGRRLASRKPVVSRFYRVPSRH